MELHWKITGLCFPHSSTAVLPIMLKIPLLSEPHLSAKLGISMFFMLWCNHAVSGCIAILLGNIGKSFSFGKDSNWKNKMKQSPRFFFSRQEFMYLRLFNGSMLDYNITNLSHLSVPSIVSLRKLQERAMEQLNFFYCTLTIGHHMWRNIFNFEKPVCSQFKPNAILTNCFKLFYNKEALHCWSQYVFNVKS